MSKTPAKSSAPPTVFRTGNWLMVSSLVLLAMAKPPPMVVSSGNDKLLRLPQAMKDRDPPVLVRLGAEKVSKVANRVPKSPPTLASEGIETSETLMKVTGKSSVCLGADRSEKLTVSSGLEVGQADLEVCRVGSEGQSTSDIAQVVHIDLSQVSIVIDVHAGDGLELDARQAGQSSIGDLDIVCATNTGTEVKGLQGSCNSQKSFAICRKGATYEAR